MYQFYLCTMIEMQRFTFNPFSENTYVLWDDSMECVIIDPGCYNHSEQVELKSFIESNGLKPVYLLNTHCHIDHIFGNAYCKRTFNIPFLMHKSDLPVLESGLVSSKLYGLSYEESPEPDQFISEGETIKFGHSVLDIVFTPGHSPGSVCFIAHSNKLVIGGDVLFQQSIGRTDLPGGNTETLLNSIRTELFTLPDEYTVFPGHGPETQIGFEKANNPFLNGSFTTG